MEDSTAKPVEDVMTTEEDRDEEVCNSNHTANMEYHIDSICRRRLGR